jgi:hypothetical protein
VLLADVVMSPPVKFDGLATEVGQDLEADQASFLVHFTQGGLARAFPGLDVSLGKPCFGPAIGALAPGPEEEEDEAAFVFDDDATGGVIATDGPRLLWDRWHGS